MKRFCAFISALLIMLLGFAVPVKAAGSDFDHPSKITLNKSYSGKLNNTSDFYKISVQSGDLKVNIRITQHSGTNVTSMILFDSDGKEIPIDYTEYSIGKSYIYDDVWLRTNYNSVNKYKGYAVYRNLKKGDYVIQFVDWSTSNYSFSVTSSGKAAEVSTKSSSDDYPALFMNKGDTINVGGVFGGKASQDVSLSTTDKKVAKFDSDGNVTAAGKGTAVITVKSGSSSVNVCIVVQ